MCFVSSGVFFLGGAGGVKRFDVFDGAVFVNPCGGGGGGDGLRGRALCGSVCGKFRPLSSVLLRVVGGGGGRTWSSCFTRTQGVLAPPKDQNHKHDFVLFCDKTYICTRRFT